MQQCGGASGVGAIVCEERVAFSAGASRATSLRRRPETPFLLHLPGGVQLTSLSIGLRAELLAGKSHNPKMKQKFEIQTNSTPIMSDKKEKKHKRRRRENGEQKGATTPFSLLADEKAIDPTLSSLFAAKISYPDQKAEKNGQPAAVNESESEEAGTPPAIPSEGSKRERKRKRKREDGEGEVEDVYMRRLAREEARDADQAAAERASKRAETQVAAKEAVGEDADEVDTHDTVDALIDNDDSESDAEPNEPPASPDSGEEDAPPLHETAQAAALELSKATRTVFLGNISTLAITSKTSHKTLLNHLKSFFPALPPPKNGENPKHHKIESLRFRSTPYTTTIPKKAAYATKQLMNTTSQSTNAYAIYSTPLLAREAVTHLNGSIVLDRHLRVDSVAHPSPVDHKRCVFVGNLGFVDDESNIQAANEEDGREKRKPSKFPADVEEGLWRTFGRCGEVESVRVVRDGITRVGKGIAYVQFRDVDAVEAALLLEGKKFPPMLPRKLRVARAKAQKRHAKPGSDRPSTRPRANDGYQRKVSDEEASKMGRAGKLFGRAAAAQMKQDKSGVQRVPNGIKKPEAFVFEGHRARRESGKAGVKLSGRGGGGGGKKKSGKPVGRSARRGAAFRVKGGKGGK